MENRIPFSVRNYQPNDFEHLLNLINQCSRSDAEPFSLTATQLKDKLDAPDTIPAEDVFIVESSALQVVAYAEGFLRSRVNEQFFLTRASILPAFRHQRIGAALLSRLWARGVELSLQHSKTTIMGARVTADNQFARLLFAQFDMQQERTLIEMVCELSTGIRQQVIPAGIELIKWREHGDVASVLEAQNQACRDHWNFLPETLDRYQHNLASGKYSLDHSMIALESGRVVGGAICQTGQEVNILRGENQAYLNNLFVKREARKRGIGTALLVAAMHAAKNAGHASIALNVDAENPTGAVRVYTKVGFKDKIHWVIYHRVCDDTPALISDYT